MLMQQEIAHLVLKDDMSYKLAKSIHNNIISSVGAVDRGIKRGNYQVLRDSSCPSVLIETGFLTNYKESVNLSKNSYQNKLANAIVKGIQEYISMNHNINGVNIQILLYLILYIIFC